MHEITAVTAAHQHCASKAKRLATKLHLPFVEIGDHNYLTLLIVTDKRLELQLTESKSSRPIYVDFLSGTLAHRRQFGGGRGQLIAKAVGLQNRKHISILDVTAGLGRDSFVLANLGCKVTMIERNPIIAALLKDGLMRAKKETWFKALELTLIENDAIYYLKSLENLPDVIYIDPMFPSRKKSALVKKEMRVLRHVVGDDEDASILLSTALKKATKRIVVKRPRLAPAISGPEPDFSFKGKSSRFDVYLSN